MKPLLLLPGLLTLVISATAADRPLWMRQPAVSPDGKHIAFTYGGQVWRVAGGGGEAVSLTGAAAAAGTPVWSPDSARLAFSSLRHGNADIFIMPAAGGEARRLTTHSAVDTPYAFTPDGKSVLFNSVRLGDARAALGGILVGASQQLYSIPADGGRERLVIPLPALDAAPSADGRFILYTSLAGRENEWRKHAVSAATRDIWIYDTAQRSHRQFTTWGGEDRDAVWSADGKSVLWLCEQSGSFNVWQRALAGDAPAVQLTQHKTHPVRFLSRSDAGDIVYGYDGEIWKLAAGAKEPQRVAVKIAQASLIEGTITAKVNGEVSELAASHDGAQLAIVARGEIFVVEAASGKTRRITSTPEHERNVSFSPDGKALLFARERDGRFDAWEISHTAPGAASFLTAGALTETRLTDTKTDVTDPAYSPDGKRVAYYENRTRLMVMDRATKQTVTALPEGLSYSYRDGDLPFQWSPDSRWLAATTGSGAKSFDVHLADATGHKPPVNLSRSGWHALRPVFSPDGQAVYYMSTRDGLQTADSKPGEFDVYVTFLTQSAYDAMLHPADGPAAAPEKKAAPWEPELDDLANRTLRVTPFSSQVQFYKITPDGKALVLVSASALSGLTGYKIPLGSPGIAPLFNKPPAAVGSFVTDGKGENLFFAGAAGIERINLASGAAATIPFQAEMAYDLRGEMRYFFQHVWRMTQQKFYRADMGGVDWELYRREYEKYLPHISRGEDLAEMFSEMAGELNASHMGSRYLPPAGASGDETASLGLYYDHAHTGPGVKITDYLKTGPAGRAGSLLRPGAVILTVNGTPVREDADIHTLLNHMAGQTVRLTIQPAGGRAAAEEVVTPEPFGNSLSRAHSRWVAQRVEQTDKLSAGRLGYVHIGAMDTANYQSFVADLHGRCRDKEAVVVDVRFNRGGNLTGRLIADLSAKLAGQSVDRAGRVLANDPSDRWTKPGILIANAFSYSDGSIFPHSYKDAKLGLMVGEPVPGTGTAVWWMDLLPDDRFQYGIPEIPRKNAEGRFYENTQDEPDILVRRNPDAFEEGRDEQLEAAVTALLKQLDAAK